MVGTPARDALGWRAAGSRCRVCWRCARMRAAVARTERTKARGGTGEKTKKERRRGEKNGEERRRTKEREPAEEPPRPLGIIGDEGTSTSTRRSGSGALGEGRRRAEPVPAPGREHCAGRHGWQRRTARTQLEALLVRLCAERGGVRQCAEQRGAARIGAAIPTRRWARAVRVGALNTRRLTLAQQQQQPGRRAWLGGRCARKCVGRGHIAERQIRIRCERYLEDAM